MNVKQSISIKGVILAACLLLVLSLYLVSLQNFDRSESFKNPLKTPSRKY